MSTRPFDSAAIHRPPAQGRRGPNRLTSEIWRDSGGVLQDRKVYFYDEASNRSRLEQDGEPTVYYTYDARNAMTSVEPAGGTATTMEYNASGSLVKETTGADVTYYVWGADEMLEAVQLPDESWNYFSYDGDQRRWQKTDGDGTKRYRWNAGTSGKPGLAVVQEADDSDDTTAQYTHDQGATIMPGVGTILSVRESETSHFLHTDAQGTTREATDSSQAVDATFDLDAFGVLRGSSGAFTTPYLFTGKERDPGPGLDYFIARQYAPTLGVFLSKDPIPTPTWMYSYAHQAPLSGWDPDGLLCGGSAACYPVVAGGCGSYDYTRWGRLWTTEEDLGPCATHCTGGRSTQYTVWARKQRVEFGPVTFGAWPLHKEECCCPVLWASSTDKISERVTCDCPTPPPSPDQCPDDCDCLRDAASQISYALRDFNFAVGGGLVDEWFARIADDLGAEWAYHLLVGAFQSLIHMLKSIAEVDPCAQRQLNRDWSWALLQRAIDLIESLLPIPSSLDLPVDLTEFWLFTLEPALTKLLGELNSAVGKMQSCTRADRTW